VHAYPAGPREPRAEELAVMLATMAERRCAGAVVEVSADSLRRASMDGIAFQAAVLTDLDGPALELAEIQSLRRAHRRLFRMVVPGGVSVINTDDPHAELLGAVHLGTHRLGFGCGPDAEVRAVIERQDARGTHFRLIGQGREARVRLRLPGARQVSHALAAAAVAWSRGVGTEQVVAGLESVTMVPGRLEPVEPEQSFGVWVDGARTGTELAEALRTVRAIVPGKLFCVVDAAVDCAERQSLAEAAEQLADRVIVSVEDPQADDREAVVERLMSAFRRPGRVRVELDRKRAIEAALEVMTPGDGLVIAGSGRRRLCLDGPKGTTRDDRSIATAWLRRRGLAAQKRSA
jgi:UDP-N-acetylmuramoyl-L-alanyl-D-glutamate--2,6-diaminopimelate ligase